MGILVDSIKEIKEKQQVLQKEENVPVVQDGVILSPEVIGDNILNYPLGDGLVVCCGMRDKNSFLQVLNAAGGVLWERESPRNVLVVARVEADFVKFLQSIYSGMTPAFPVKPKNLVPKIYARFMPLLHNMRQKCVTSVSIMQNRDKQKMMCDVFFSTDTNTQPPTTISCGNGIINNDYYFGTMIPITRKKYNEQGEYEGQQTRMELHLIFNDHHYEPLTNQLKEQFNLKCRNDKLSDDKPRWSYKKMKQYVNAREHYPFWTPQKMFEELQAQFRKYIHFNEDEHYSLLPLWVIGTYLTPLFKAYPYINLWGLKNTGKTKVMELCKILCLNSTMLANTSCAALFRIIEQDCPTLFLDEVENLFDEKNQSEEASSIVSILNAGWMSGSTVTRVEKVDDSQEVGRFNVYCPKMLGSIKGIRGALESRSINIVMVRALNNPVSDTWMKEDDKVLTNIRDELYSFILKNWKEIDMFYDDECPVGLKKEFKLSNRDWQVWKPLLCIAKLVSEELYQKIGKWAVMSVERGSDDSDDDSWDGKVSEALIELVQSEVHSKYYVKDLKVLVDKYFIERIITDSQGNETPIYQKSRPSNTFIGRFLNRIGLNKFRKREGGGKVYYFLKRFDVLAALEASHAIVMAEKNTSHIDSGTPPGSEKAPHSSQVTQQDSAKKQESSMILPEFDGTEEKIE